MIDLYSFIFILQYYPNPTRDIMGDNFLHEVRTRHERNTKLEN
jgi:hypothetical protein